MKDKEMSYVDNIVKKLQAKNIPKISQKGKKNSYTHNLKYLKKT